METTLNIRGEVGRYLCTFLIQAFSQQDVVSWEKRSQKVAGNDQIRESPASFPSKQAALYHY